MTSAYSNRKKVRGWKRQIQRLERLKNEHLNLDFDFLEQYGYEYVKLWIDPWNRLIPRNPPAWFRRRILAVMIEIYDSWSQQLSLRGEPFYLAIWLFHPRFYRTQVVAGIRERINHYETLFEPSGKSVPLTSYSRGVALIGDFDWDPMLDNDLLEEELDYWSPVEIQHFERTASKIYDAEPERGLPRMFEFHRGHVWLGRRKNDRASSAKSDE